MNFKTALAAGRFCIPLCVKCKRVAWPPAEFSSCCLDAVFLKEGDLQGRVIEFSEYENHYFCLVAFEEKVRVMAKMLSKPETGQKVGIVRCGITEKGDYFFDVS